MKTAALPMRNRAFTLIELMVVIAIILALAGLLFPGLQRSKQSAQMSQCSHNMQQIGVAISASATDNNNRPVGWYRYSTGQYWWQMLEPYLSAGTNASGPITSNSTSSNSIFRCPADINFQANNVAQSISYAWNYVVMGRSDNDQPPLSGQTGLNIIPLLDFVRPSHTLVLTDSHEPIVGAPSSWGYIDYYGQSPDPIRHQGRTNGLFLDGHVETLDTTAVSTQEPYLDRSVVTQ